MCPTFKYFWTGNVHVYLTWAYTYACNECTIGNNGWLYLYFGVEGASVTYFSQFQAEKFKRIEMEILENGYMVSPPVGSLILTLPNETAKLLQLMKYFKYYC